MDKRKWFQSIINNNQREFMEFIEEEIDINTTDDDKNDNWSALHYAVFYQRWDMVKILLEKGINPNILDSYERTAIFGLIVDTVVEDKVFVEIAELLLKYGCDPNLRDNNDDSILSYLTEFEQDGVLPLFKKYEHLLDNENKKLIS